MCVNIHFLKKFFHCSCIVQAARATTPQVCYYYSMTNGSLLRISKNFFFWNNCDIRQQDRCWSKISAPCLYSLSTERCLCSGGLDSVWLPHAAEKSVPPSWFTTQPATQRLHHFLPHSWCTEQHTINLVTRCSGVTWRERYMILKLMEVRIWK